MTKAKTFGGGIHPRYNKERTLNLPIVDAVVPKELVFPLSQHIGAPCQPLVKVGERVLKGQKIADSDAPISAPIHSSVSGQVVAIEKRPHCSGQDTMAIVVSNDGLDEEAVPASTGTSIENVPADEIVRIVREAGIVGMGGAGFPTHYKMVPPAGTKVEMVVLNGAECEPYLTADYRLMMEESEQVVLGLRLLMKALGADKGCIGVEEDKSEAIAALKQAREAFPDIEVIPLQVKYPQGSEFMLIRAITGKELPVGRLPAELGVIVNNVATAVAVANAVTTGKPLVERVVTVSGSMVERPQNLRVRLGTPVGALLEQCGLKGQPGKVIKGGPMMGVTLANLDVPVIKTTCGLLALSPEEAEPLEISPCIRCGRCVDVCPMRLQPVFIAQFVERGMLEQAEAYNATDCRECGCCSYICPARRPLVQNIRLAKSAILAKRRK